MTGRSRLARVGLLLADNESDERRLAQAVGADDAEHGAGRELKGEVA